jgi:hypothetical protein
MTELKQITHYPVISALQIKRRYAQVNFVTEVNKERTLKFKANAERLSWNITLQPEDVKALIFILQEADILLDGMNKHVE